MFDVKTIRKDFPVLEKQMWGKPVVYFDNAATALKPLQVIDAEVHYYKDLGANIHRGLYQLSEKATQEYNDVRKKVASFINAPSEEQIVFTKGTTDSINLVMYSWGRKNIQEGDEIILSEMEHHSNLVPWHMLAEEKKARLKFIPVNEKEAVFDLSSLDDIITERTKLVSLSAMSNVTGVIHDLKSIIDTAHRKNALVIVDGAQFVSHHRMDVQEMDCDFLAFSSHKMCGPTGVGVLYGKKHILDDMPPFMGGGDMILRVKKDKTEYEKPPLRFEAGTPNIAGVIGFGRAIDYIKAVGLDNIHEYEQQLVKYAMEEVQKIDDFIIYGTKDYTKKGGIMSFNIGNVHSHDTGSILDRQGIAVRVGHHCCQPIMKLFGIHGTTRASFYFYNTVEEIDKFVKSIDRVKEVFSGI